MRDQQVRRHRRHSGTIHNEPGGWSFVPAAAPAVRLVVHRYHESTLRRLLTDDLRLLELTSREFMPRPDETGAHIGLWRRGATFVLDCYGDESSLATLEQRLVAVVVAEREAVTPTA